LLKPSFFKIKISARGSCIPINYEQLPHSRRAQQEVNETTQASKSLKCVLPNHSQKLTVNWNPQHSINTQVHATAKAENFGAKHQ
jgi:hypothetical protein